MRLTEALSKVLYQRAIDTNKTDSLSHAFQKHLGLKDKFKQVQTTGSDKKVWKKLGVKGYECYAFSKTISASESFPQETAIERVMHEVWPSRVDAQPPATMSTLSSQPVQPQARAGPGKSRSKGNQQGGGKASKQNPQQTRVPVSAEACVTGSSAQEEARFIELFCHLWRKFHVVTKQLRCKDPKDASLKDFGKNCRDLGARWCLLLPRNRCSALYLHTLTMHGGTFMSYLLERGLTLGMMENSGAERRHQIGKVMFIKSLGGGGQLYFAMSGTEARSAYLTFRGELMWQYGRDLLAYLLAQEKSEAANGQDGKRALGWDSVKLDSDSSIAERRTKLSELQYSGYMELNASDVLTEEVLEALEETSDSSEPPDLDVTLAKMVSQDAAPVESTGNGSNNRGYINPDLPIVLSTGQFIADLDGAGHDASDIESGHDGSESSSDIGTSCSEDDGESGEDSPDEDC